MAKEGGYTISDIYQGGYSSLDPNKSYGSVFTGYHVNANQLGMTVDSRTANIIQTLNQSLNQGAIPLEIQPLDPAIFETIPKEHFKEMKRAAKLAGSKVNIHAPLIEPSGVDAKQQRPWTEAERQLAENQLNDVIEKSIELDDKGGIPVVIHSAGLPGTEYLVDKDGKKVEKIVAINKETGKLAPLEEDKKYYPEMIERDAQGHAVMKNGKPSYISLDEGQKFTPEQQLDIINSTEWDNSISQLIFNKERADEILQQNAPLIQSFLEEQQKGNVTPETLEKIPAQRQAYMHYKNAETYLDDIHKNVNGLFSKAYKYGDDKQKQKLKGVSEKYKKDLEKNPTLMGQSNAMQNLLQTLKDRRLTPEMYVPIEQFAIEKSSETLSSVALKGYELAKKQKREAPILAIENMYPGMAFSSSTEMNQLIDETKKKFVEKAQGQGLSESQAKAQADKMIGMTLDVGHLNIARKKGFKEEDLMKEVEAIGKHVKHVHLSDNFGFSDVHLPPGMGNVPTKAILEELKKKGYKGRTTIEAGGWFQHFKTNPYKQILEAMGSPMYGTQMGPYWNQNLMFNEGAYGGYGLMLPQTGFQMFGAGFSQLPMELGGTKPGAEGSRMSGKPME